MQASAMTRALAQTLGPNAFWTMETVPPENVSTLIWGVTTAAGRLLLGVVRSDLKSGHMMQQAALEQVKRQYLGDKS